MGISTILLENKNSRFIFTGICIDFLICVVMEELQTGDLFNIWKQEYLCIEKDPITKNYLFIPTDKVKNCENSIDLIDRIVFILLNQPRNLKIFTAKNERNAEFLILKKIGHLDNWIPSIIELEDFFSEYYKKFGERNEIPGTRHIEFLSKIIVFLDKKDPRIEKLYEKIELLKPLVDTLLA